MTDDNHTSKKPDIGKVGVWQGMLDRHATPIVREAVAEIEAMGWPTLWRPEALGRDPFVSAAVMLEASTDLKVATGVCQMTARHPMTAVAGQKALAEAYDNRFVLGIGVSHAPFVEGMHGLSYAKPYSQMVKYLEQMRSAQYMSVEPSEEPPLLLAALGPKMLKLAATQADGAHPYFVPPEHTAYAREIMGPDALLAPEQKVVLETDPTKAREMARSGMTFYMDLPNYMNNLRRHGFSEEDVTQCSDRLVDGVVAWGSLDDVLARIKAHHDAGADHVAIQVITGEGFGGRLPMQEWRMLAEALL